MRNICIICVGACVAALSNSQSTYVQYRLCWSLCQSSHFQICLLCHSHPAKVSVWNVMKLQQWKKSIPGHCRLKFVWESHYSSIYVYRIVMQYYFTFTKPHRNFHSMCLRKKFFPMQSDVLVRLKIFLVRS